jgi:RimJ/RimL family protein N-acetyltransferase
MTLSDVDPLAAVALDPDLWRYTTTLMRTREDVESYVRTALAWQSQGTAVPFVTVVKSEGRVVGSTRFANIDKANRRAEIGWSWISRQYQRSFVNTEAKYLMLRHAFETWGCVRVELKTGTKNMASRNAIQRIGGKEEGILRKHMLLGNGEWRDTVYYSILDSEWGEVKRELEARMAKP